MSTIFRKFRNNPSTTFELFWRQTYTQTNIQKRTLEYGLLLLYGLTHFLKFGIRVIIDMMMSYLYYEKNIIGQ